MESFSLMRFSKLPFSTLPRGLHCLVLVLSLLPGWNAGRALAQGVPIISTQPASQTVVAGTNAVVFTVAATGAAPLSYQWLKNGTNVDAATNSTYTFIVAGAADAGSYKVRVTNGSGFTDSAAAILAVNVPAIFSSTPVNLSVFVGQSASFTAVPDGTPPVTLQWLFGATTLTNATNNTFTLASVDCTNAGVYTATITNAYGSSSAFGVLTVLALPDPAIRIGPPRISSVDAIFPILYTGHGTETQLSFSMTFDPTVYTNVVFSPDSTDGITWSSDASQLAAGALGVTAVYAPPAAPIPGENQIGNISATVVPGATNRFFGKVGLTGVPQSLFFGPALVSTNSTNSALLITNSTIAILAAVPPVFTGPASPLQLNPQTGLFEQTVELVNPGNSILDGVFVTIAPLGVDSKTNTIVNQNAQGYLAAGASFITAGALAPGETRSLTAEYYVPDRVTLPVPVLTPYGAAITLAAPPAGTLLDVITNRFVPQGFLVEFATRSDRRYFVQYANQVADFSGTNAAAIFTALPSIPGTGSSIQWLDNGPPKTLSAPKAGARFYRVLETR